MPKVSRVHSSDTQVFVDGVRVVGVQSSSVEAPREYENVRGLGYISNKNKVLKSNQTATVSLDYLVVQNGFNPFATDLLNVTEQEVSIRDLANETLIQDCYLQECSLNLNVGEIPNGSVTYDANIITENEGNSLTFADQTNDSNVEVFRPQEIRIFADAEYSEGINGCDGSDCGFCIQSASLSVSMGREPINRVGEREPRMRYPTLPIEGTLSFEALKTDITGIDLTSFICETGSLFLQLLNDKGGYSTEYKIKNCNYISFSQSTDLDSNTTVTFNYEFPLKHDSITVT